MLLLGLLAFAALVNAGGYAHDKVVVEIETIHVIEYTEVCVCPTATVLPVPAITTLVCCDTCAPITVTSSAQPITSCTTAYTKTTTVCETAGVVVLGEKFYPCNSPPCVIEYEAPCPTCYVCPYSDCWVPNNIKPKHVTVYEYFGGYDREIARWMEDWRPWTWVETIVKTKWFPQPTDFMENNIEINITAPTSLTYTQTNTMTATETATVTESITIPALPSSATPIPSASPSSSPSTAPTTDLKFVLMSGSRAGYPVIVLDGKLAYGNVSNDVQTLRLSPSQLFDLNGHITYVSRSDLTLEDKSYLYFVSPSRIPADGLTDVFFVDQDKNLVVTVDGIILIAVICDNDKFIRFGYSAGSCEAVVLAPESSAHQPASTGRSSAPSVHSSPSSLAMSTPWLASSTPASHALSVAPSDAPSEAPSFAPSDPPSSIPPEITSTPISEPVSIAPSEAPSSAPPPVVSRTFSRMEAIAQATHINQGLGTQDNYDSSIIQVTAYDQFNETLPDINFILECDNSITAFCQFRLGQQLTPTASIITTENGTAQVDFYSMRSGVKLIRINHEDAQVASLDITVDAVVDCSKTSIAVVNQTNQLYSLVVGVDKPVLQATVFDLFSWPISGVNVSFGTIALLTKRVPDAITGTTDQMGMASYTVAEVHAGGSQGWTATLATCPAVTYPQMYWSYDVDCGARTVAFDPVAYTDETFVISGNFYPTAGASLAGASLFLFYQEPSLVTRTIPLGLDGHWSQNITYSGTETNWPISLQVLYSKLPCMWSNTITWKVKIPSCDALGIVTFSTTTPEVTGPVQITLASVDSLGSELPRVAFKIYSSSRGGESSGATTGVTDDTGHFTMNYWNGGYGATDEVMAFIFGDGTPSSCSTMRTISWQPAVITIT